MSYKKISIWETRHRIKVLSEFRSNVITYFKEVERTGFMETTETRESAQARIKINRKIDEVGRYLQDAGVSTTMYYAPPPAVGGIAGNINVLFNIFHIHRFQMDSNIVIDFLDRALGIYQDDAPNALFRTLNPLFWLSRVLNKLADIPFQFIGSLGFNYAAASESVMGKIIRGIFQIIIVTSALAALLKALGYLDNVRTYFGL